MRNLVLALLLANLIFAAWHSWYSDAGDQPLLHREVGEIVLASEFSESNPELSAALPRVEISGQPAPPVADGANSENPGGTPEENSNASVPGRGSDVTETGSMAEFDPASADGGVVTFSDPEIQIDPPVASTSAGGIDVGAGRPDSGCVSVGPFRELSQVAAAAANLREDGFAPGQRAGEGAVWSGYWVYIEQIDSVLAAQTMLERLHENGISDSYIIPNSDSGTLISLGVFSEIIRASRRREDARALGLTATIADRTSLATVYWIDVELGSGGPLNFERLQPPGRIVRLEQRRCADVIL